MSPPDDRESVRRKRDGGGLSDTRGSPRHDGHGVGVEIWVVKHEQVLGGQFRFGEIG
jgi:hypothetical protein